MFHSILWPSSSVFVCLFAAIFFLNSSRLYEFIQVSHTLLLILIIIFPALSLSIILSFSLILIGRFRAILSLYFKLFDCKTKIEISSLCWFVCHFVRFLLKLIEAFSSVFVNLLFWHYLQLRISNNDWIFNGYHYWLLHLIDALKNCARQKDEITNASAST